MPNWNPWVTLLVVVALVLVILYLVGIRFDLNVSQIPAYEGFAQ